MGKVFCREYYPANIRDLRYNEAIKKSYNLLKGDILKRSFIIFLILFALIALCVDVSWAKDSDVKKNLQLLTDRIRIETNIPGISVYVISDKYGSFGVVSGTIDLSTDAGVTQNTIFRMGSITKTFTGAAIVKLVKEGMISLSEEVSTYLPIKHPLLTGITVKHVLNHSSGLQAYLNGTPFIDKVLKNPQADHKPQELLELVVDVQDQLRFKPGTAFEYNNTNYIVLGMIIEAVTGISYKEYIELNFLKPLDLKDTYVLTTEDMPTDDYSRGYYDMEADRVYEDFTGTDMSYVWAAGCMGSTANDLAKWIYALGKGSVFNDETTALQRDGFAIAEGIMYGGGILLDADKGIGHNGTVVGFHADAWYNLKLGTAIAVLSNANMIEDEPYEDEEPEDRDPTLEIVEGFFEILK